MKLFEKTVSNSVRLLTLLFIIVAVFQACQNNENRNRSKTNGGTFRVTISHSVETLDPNRINFAIDFFVSSLIYEGLVQTGNDYDSIEPLLAERWHRLDNGKRFIFYLRDNVFFHDDPCFRNDLERKLTAYDVLFTFKRIASQKNPSINYNLFADKILGLSQFHDGVTKEIEGINILDSLTIEFKLSKPYVTFLKLLASPSAYILSKRGVIYYENEIDKHPIGTGPFKLSIWNPTEELYLIKNNDYWKTDNSGNLLPFLSSVSFRILKSPDFKVTNFLKGECDYINLTRKDYENVIKTNKSINFKIKKTRRYFGIRFFGFSFDNNSIFAKKKQIRRAIAFAFKRKAIYDSPDFRFSPVNTLVPPELLGNPNQKWYDFNLQKAKSLMKKEKSSIKNCSIFSSVYSPSIKLLEKGINNIGIKVDTKILHSQYYKKIIELRPDIFRVSMMPSFLDPTEYYSMFYSKNGKFTNLFSYSNPKFDKIYEQCLVEQRKADRRKLFIKLEKILKDDVAAIYVSQSGVTYDFISNRTAHFATHGAFPDFSRIRLKK